MIRLIFLKMERALLVKQNDPLVWAFAVAETHIRQHFRTHAAIPRCSFLKFDL